MQSATSEKRTFRSLTTTKGNPLSDSVFSDVREFKSEPGRGHTTDSADSNPQASNVPERFIVFMFDDMHLSIGDLAQTQKAGINMLVSIFV